MTTVVNYFNGETAKPVRVPLVDQPTAGALEQTIKKPKNLSFFWACGQNASEPGA
jgi:hypothetical protein